MDIADFLPARLDEDEREASGPVNAAKMLGAKPDFYGAGGPAAEAFWARFDPARVLADIAARRRLLDLHAAEDSQHPDFCGHDKHELPCPTLRALAQPYAGHPDYDPAWAPVSGG